MGQVTAYNAITPLDVWVNVRFGSDVKLPNSLVPMIRHTFPELITHDIINVQPMSGPVGIAFALNYRYAQP